MTETVPLLNALKLFNQPRKAKAPRSGDKSKHKITRLPRDAYTAPTAQDMWPAQAVMFGLPTVPRAAPKPYPTGSRTTSSKIPPTLSSRPFRQPYGLAELEAPTTSSNTLSELEAPVPVLNAPSELEAPTTTSNTPSELEAPTTASNTPGELEAPANGSTTPSTLSRQDLRQPFGPAELEAPIPSFPKLPIELSSDSTQGDSIASPVSETPAMLSHPASVSSPDLVESCAYQRWADHPSNKVHNILKEMRTPIQSNRGGYVYCFVDATAKGQLKIGSTETWDEPWVQDIPDSTVYRPELHQSSTLGGRIRQRKSTCGLWPVVKLVAPMKYAARKMETLVRSTLVDCRKRNECQPCDNDEEWFNCRLEEVERVLRLWQRFSNLQPFTSSGQLDAVWCKYAKQGLRGKWNIYSIDKWVSASWEPMLGKMERESDKWGILEGFEPDQRIALQVIIRALREQKQIEKGDER